MKNKFLILSTILLIFFVRAGNAANPQIGAKDSMSTIKVKITVGNKNLTATLDDNATTRSFIKKLPTTLPMMDLYGREMCYRFNEALPTDDLQYTGYKIGEIVYWPPRHSFVIMYKQNGEKFDMQKIGKIDSGIETFENIGNVNVKFELSE